MGFESAYAARRRLALVAESNEFVQEAVHHGVPDGSEPGGRNASARVETGKFIGAYEVAGHLDQLAHEIISTPGAGGALLVAFAAQARALSLVMEAARRTQGAAMLPAEVMAAVQNALRAPTPRGLEMA